MGQVLHGSATTIEVVRLAIQHSKKSLRALARRYGVNQKTVAKWGKRSSRDCQEFRVWAGITGKKETRYVPTQRACDTE